MSDPTPVIRDVVTDAVRLGIGAAIEVVEARIADGTGPHAAVSELRLMSARLGGGTC